MGNSASQPNFELIGVNRSGERYQLLTGPWNKIVDALERDSYRDLFKELVIYQHLNHQRTEVGAGEWEVVTTKPGKRWA